MSDIDSRVEEERKLFDEVLAAGEALAQALKPHRENMASVRGWRLNIKRNLERLQQPLKKRLSEDILSQLKSTQEGVNEALGELTRVLRLDIDGQVYQNNIEGYKEALTRLKETSGFERQKSWENELTEIDRQVTQNATKVEEFREKIKQAQNDQQALEDKRKEAVRTLKSELGEGLSPYVKGVDDTKNQQIVAKFDEDIKSEFELDKSWLNEAITVFIDDQDDTPEQEFIYQVVQENFSGRLAVLQEAVLADIYFPANPTGKRIGTLDTDTPYQDLVSKVESQLARIEPVSYRVKAKIEPLRLAVTARLSSPKRSIEEDSKLPQKVVERLLELTHGKYENTLKASDEINAYASEYGTLPLEVTETRTLIVNAIGDLNEKVLQLTELASSFSSKRNSARGRQVTSELRASTHRLNRATSKQYVAFTSALANFENAVTQMKTWFDEKWYQFGGQPANHKSAGAGDQSEANYKSVPKSKANLKNF